MKIDTQLIVNADDFGSNLSVNEGVLESFRMGTASSASLILSGPGLDDALNKISSHLSLLGGHVGLHINLTEGHPFTDPIKACERFVDRDGLFCYKREHPVFFLSAEEKKAIALEVGAQLDACARYGVTPTHVDSHHHIHTEWPIGRIVVAAAKGRGIRRIRTTRNIGPGIAVTKRLYKALFKSVIVSRSGMISSRYFGSFKDWLSTIDAGSPKPGVCEIMVHLVRQDGGVIDQESGFRIEEMLSMLRSFELIGFGDLG